MRTRKFVFEIYWPFEQQLKFSLFKSKDFSAVEGQQNNLLYHSIEKGTGDVGQPKILVSLPESFQLILRNWNGVFQNNPTDNFIASRSSQRPLQVEKMINMVSSSRNSFRINYFTNCQIFCLQSNLNLNYGWLLSK